MNSYVYINANVSVRGMELPMLGLTHLDVYVNVYVYVYVNAIN